MSKQPINRRAFLERSAQGVGFLAATGAAIAASARMAAGAAEKPGNPFGYDITRFAKTDPKLIRYEEAGRFSSPNSEPRRIAVGPGDRLYVANKKGVDVLEGDGTQVYEISLEAPARCVAVATDGTTYIGLKDHVEI